MRPIRMGVVGAGGLGYHHVRILRNLEGVELAGFHDARPDRAEQVARELSVRSFASVSELIASTDALTVVVPTPAHHAVAKAALEAGRHLLVEKPLAATLEEADEMVALAARNGLVLQTGHVERFNRAIRSALPFVRQPQFIESDRLAPFNPRGADVAGTQVHSVRVPSFVVSTEVVFGLADERLTIRHDAGGTPEPYVAGTLLAARRAPALIGLTRGLDSLLVG